jgi:hypothetical protein
MENASEDRSGLWVRSERWISLISALLTIAGLSLLERLGSYRWWFIAFAAIPVVVFIGRRALRFLAPYSNPHNEVIPVFPGKLPTKNDRRTEGSIPLPISSPTGLWRIEQSPFRCQWRWSQDTVEGIVIRCPACGIDLDIDRDSGPTPIIDCSLLHCERCHFKATIPADPDELIKSIARLIYLFHLEHDAM